MLRCETWGLGALTAFVFGQGIDTSFPVLLTVGLPFVMGIYLLITSLQNSESS